MDKIEKARLNTYCFWFAGNETCLCPKCQEYMIISGYRCFGCGYDGSALKKEDEI